MRIFAVSIMVITLSGCGSIISRTIPGQGHGNQYYPGVQWDMRDSAWRYITILDLPFSLSSIHCYCRSIFTTGLMSN